jgi:hypothetical protein
MKTTMRGPYWVLLVALGCTALVAGCGGDDDDDDGGETITKSEYIDRANASCREHEAVAAEAYEVIVGGGQPTPAEAQEFLAIVAEEIRAGSEERAEIPAPEGDEEEIAAINAAAEEAAAGFEEAAASPEAARALMTGETPEPATEVDQLNREYGVEECSGGN